MASKKKLRKRLRKLNHQFNTHVAAVRHTTAIYDQNWKAKLDEVEALKDNLATMQQVADFRAQQLEQLRKSSSDGNKFHALETANKEQMTTIARLRDRLASTEKDRDAWRVEAERLMNRA